MPPGVGLRTEGSDTGRRARIYLRNLNNDQERGPFEDRGDRSPSPRTSIDSISLLTSPTRPSFLRPRPRRVVSGFPSQSTIPHFTRPVSFPMRFKRQSRYDKSCGLKIDGEAGHRQDKLQRDLVAVSVPEVIPGMPIVKPTWRNRRPLRI